MTERLSGKDLVEVWKNVISVQMHFNTVKMTVRNIFATLVVALVGGVGYSYKEKVVINFAINLTAASVLALTAVFITLLFYFVDRFWYHRLLIGSVKEATRLEDELSKISDVPIRLSKQISDESPVMLPRLVRVLVYPLVSEKRFRDTGRLHSDGKIELFYKSVAVMFIVIAVVTCR